MNSNKQQNLPSVILPMRFYANWDVDRTSSPITVQRILSMVFTRLVLNKTLISTQNTPITIAVRLQGNRRILRSNDLSISPLRLDIPLDISFTIQYSHYIKRKSNILQIFIQRRKRYKNRQIPGFKTLAMGHLNLDEILQFGGSREIPIWDTTCLNKDRHSMRELHAGKIFIANCFTQAVESTESYRVPPNLQPNNQTREATNGKENIILSDEEAEDFSSGDDSESDIDYTPRGEIDQSAIERRQKKFLKQRNIKQRVIALLRKFKPDEEATTSECPHASRIIEPPTEQELQEIFEELGNISDSGPELEPDKLSIISNPRPKIRPFFGSKSDIMPPIVDYQNEEGLFLSDELSEDSEILSSNEEPQIKQEDEENNRKESSQSYPIPTNYVRPLLIHSETINMVLSNEQKHKDLDPVEELLIKLENVTPPSQILPEHIWICSSVDLNWLSKVNSKLLEPIYLFDCPNANGVRALFQAIIGKIQNFCNNNSVSPPTTIIGVLGGDHLLANLLKAYVHFLQDKACKEHWLNYLRFSLLLPPTSAVGRLLNQVAGFGGYSEAIWKVLCRTSKTFADGSDTSAGTVEYNEIRNCLMGLTSGKSAHRCTNLQIGEVMLQLANVGSVMRPDTSEGKLQVFVPFLAELLTGLNVGNELQCSVYDPSFTSLYFINQPSVVGEERQQINEIPNTSAAAIPSTSQDSKGYPTQHSLSSPSIPAALTIGEIKDQFEEEHHMERGNLSPPRQGSAKNSHSESRELQIEYWTALNYPCSSSTATTQFHQQREESIVGSKFSMKASVRALSIAREPMTNLLSILFVKERKKDKVLQKLGRRNKQQKSIDAGTGFCPQSRVVSGVSRIVCTIGTGIGKKDAAIGMDVSIDGVLWRGVRFFQIGAQWQTHVKLFPVSFPMELLTTIPM